jgi:ADP-L-glycero-D-manno-heptose 6-epimerase
MIIVTGGAGFIGSNLVAELNARGCADIVIIDALGCGEKWKNIAKRRFVDFVFPDEAEKFLNGLDKADAVFHLGANSSTVTRDADEVIRSNFRASTLYWNWCARAGAPLIYASSAAAYGDGAQGFDDDESEAAQARLRPLNLYGWSKLAFDRWAVMQAARGFKPPHWAGLRFFNVYGPNEYHKGDMQSLVAKNAARVAAREPVALFRSHRSDYGDGEQLRDFIYVKDCCTAMMRLYDEHRADGLFNVGTGEARSFRDLVLAIGAALGETPDIRFVDMPEAIRPNYQYFTQAKADKLIAAVGPLKFHSLEEGVADYVQSWLAQPDPYR